MKLQGLAVALATPFTSDEAVDLDGFRRLAAHVLRGGADTLVVLGSTGEAAMLTEDERDALVEAALDASQGHPVVVGTGHSSTRRAAAWTRRAAELGAQAALVATPAYVKPSPEGLVAHFRALADAAPGLPLIAYNVPGRTGQNLTPELLSRLWELDAVVALKESSGDLAQVGRIARELPAGKTLLSGDDHLALPSIALGAEGLVSVMGNVLPGPAKDLVELARAGRRDEAARRHAELLPVVDALFCESNPIPLKAALSVLSIASDVVRLPLTRPEPATHARVSEALQPFVRAERLFAHGS